MLLVHFVFFLHFLLFSKKWCFLFLTEFFPLFGGLFQIIAPDLFLRNMFLKFCIVFEGFHEKDIGRKWFLNANWGFNLRLFLLRRLFFFFFFNLAVGFKFELILPQNLMLDVIYI
jgi:hypothetical protein